MQVTFNGVPIDAKVKLLETRERTETSKGSVLQQNRVSEQMSDDITIDGKNDTRTRNRTTVKDVAEEVLLEIRSENDLQAARTLVNSRKDKYDTVGITLEGKNYLVLTQSSNWLNTTDTFRIDGKLAQVNFTENEFNTPKEILKDWLLPSALFGIVGGALGVSLADGGKAGLIGLSAGLVPLAIGAVRALMVKPDESITNSIAVQ